MPKVNTFNYDTIASWNGSQDLFVVEQPDGTKVATPAMVKQFIEAGDFEATGEVVDGHGNKLNDMAKSADVDAEIGDLSQTGLTGDSVAEQLGDANGQIAVINTALSGKVDAFLNSPVISLSANMTYQIPSNFLDRTFIIIAGNRYAWSGSQIVLTDQIKAGDASAGIKIVFGASTDPTQDKSAILTISNTGLLTLTNITNMAPYLYFHILAV